MASSSPYRRSLLSRLGLPFECLSPSLDETTHAGETPLQLANRLAYEKAIAVSKRVSEKSVIIGSDQVACIDSNILSKPGNHENAKRQLQLSSGKTVEFHTAVCVYNVKTELIQQAVVPYTAIFRQLSDEMIENYLIREKPYDCAGAFKSESLGIALFEKLEGDDPTALIGLPLIQLTSMLEQAGINVI